MMIPSSSSFSLTVLPGMIRTSFHQPTKYHSSALFVVATTSKEKPSNDNHLPPGRPTNRFLSLFFDDSIRLLNPKDMKLLKRKEQYGPIFKTNIFFRPTVFMTDIESIQELGKQEPTKSMNAYFPPHHQKLFGEQSILVQSGETHRRLRGLIQRALTPNIVSYCQPILETSISNFVAQVADESKVNGYVTIVPKLRSFFISIMLQVVLGTTDVSPKLAKDVEIWSRGLLAPPLTFIPWSTAGKAMRARRRVATQILSLMQLPSSGLLKQLMDARDEDGKALSHDEIVDNIFTIIFAGSDTTASAVTSMWMTLALDPQLSQDLIYNEEKQERFVTQVLEAMPPGPFSFRELTEDVTIGSYTIPSKWLVVYGYAAALEEKPYPTTKTLASSPKDGATIVFGTGPRRCPGRFLASLELDVFARELVKYKWELDSAQNLVQRYTPGFFPVDGLRLKAR